MTVDNYRTVSFDQGDRLKTANETRLKRMKDAEANPGNLALRDLALVGLKEFMAIHKTGGICEALSLKWLKTKFKENSDQWALERLKAGARVGIVDREKTVDRAFARYAAMNPQHGLEDFYGLKATFDQHLLITKQGATSYVAKTVSESKHGYFLHIIKCPMLSDVGTHAIAYYTSSGKVLNISNHVYMFDPDYGEYKVPNGDFKTWMPKFLLKFYGTGESDTVAMKTITLGAKRATP